MAATRLQRGELYGATAAAAVARATRHVERLLALRGESATSDEGAVAEEQAQHAHGASQML